MIRILGALAAAIMLAIAAAPHAMAIDGKAFLASDGAKAFRAGKYDAALAGFRALLKAHPNDPLILRYIAITLDRLGRLDEAVAAFRKTLEIAPGNVSALFFLGATEYERANFRAAHAAFSQAAAKDPKGRYGERAREFIAAIEKNAQVSTAPAAARRWDLFVQLGLQWDDNVGQSPDTAADRDSFRTFEYVRGGFRVLDQDGWRLRLEASGYFTQNWQNDFDSLDLQFAEAAVKIDKTFSLGEVSVQPGLRYGLTGVFLDSDRFKVGHRVWATANVGWSARLKSAVSYKLSIDDFENEGPLPVVTSRDGITHRLGGAQYLIFETFGRTSNLSVGYTFTRSEADGVNHDSDAHNLAAGLSLALPMKLDLSLGGFVGWDRYDSFVGAQGARKTRIWGVSAGLSRPITDRLSASLSVTHTRENSNYALLDFDRTIVTFALGYSF